ncbi:MAG: DUF4381 domain-containing protein [Chromatiales bacterium]|jgi:hypothetical protein
MDPTQYLRDIRGLDSVPWWPVAPGWWYLLAALLLTFALALLLRWWLRRVRRNWRDEARAELRRLRRGVQRGDAREALGETAELVRRIAMARFGRRACAGLIGEDWLAWLQANDPRGFEWRREGRILIDALYAPPGTRVERRQVMRLLDAILAWTAEPTVPRPVAGRSWRPLRLRPARSGGRV